MTCTKGEESKRKHKKKEINEKTKGNSAPFTALASTFLATEWLV